MAEIIVSPGRCYLCGEPFVSSAPGLHVSLGPYSPTDVLRAMAGLPHDTASTAVHQVCRDELVRVKVL